MSIYILQKDLPDLKSGTQFNLLSNGLEYGVHFTYKGENESFIKNIYTKEIVENNPEWFKLKEEKTNVRLLVPIQLPYQSEDGCTSSYRFDTDKKIPEDRIKHLKLFIESFLNTPRDANYTFHHTRNCKEKFTEVDMANCFCESRKNEKSETIYDRKFKFKKFEDYINSLNK